MRPTLSAALGALLILGAAAGPARAATFGAAVLTPVIGPPVPAGDVVGLAPVRRASALTLTRAVDAASPRLQRAHATGTHFKTVSLSWSAAGGAVQSICLGDVAVTSYAVRAPPGGGRSIEHETLLFAAAARASGPGPAACARLAPLGPVLVRLSTGPTGALRASVDCLAARCLGRLRLACPTEGCPAGGLEVGSFALTAGQERVLGVPLPRRVRGRHPRLKVSVTLAGHPAPFVTQVVVDPPPPSLPPSLTSTMPSPSPSPSPTPSPGQAPSPGGTGTGTGTGTGAGTGAGAGTGTGTVPDAGPVVGGPSGGPGPGPGPGGDEIDTTLGLTCDGTPGHLRGVHGVLGPSLAGQSIEIDYVPADLNADTIIHHVTTGPAGRFSDSAGAPFVQAVAFYAGDDTYVSSDAFCPAGDG